MRVNLVNPGFLTDQHLMAEYRESFMLPGSLKNWLKTQTISAIENKIPEKFPLGKGHILFFANKGKYMSDRYNLLINELSKRGYDLDFSRKTYPLHIHPTEFQNNYTPDEDAFSLIYERISSRILLKPEWYKYKGVSFVKLSSELQNNLLFRK